MTKNRGPATAESLIEQREAWLEGKDLTVRTFSDSLIGVDYNTAVRWIKSGRQPRSMAMAVILASFPDFPV